MDVLKSEVLEKWLEIEFYNIANKARLIHKHIDTDEKLIYDTIRCLDHESIMSESPSVNYIITVIGLMWEHIDHSKYDLRHAIIKFLSRIGYPTSAIICDDGFDRKQCSFSHLSSWVDEILTTMQQEDSEVIISDRKYLLTNFQKRIWDSMDCDKILGISAPTSAGKSFVILLKLVSRLIQENLDIVYIVPTLSLLNQVTEDFNRELKCVGANNYYISNSFDGEQVINENHIYVMTQEKAIAAFSDSDKAFSKKLILVADEIQNIERIKEDKDQRSKILFDTLVEFRYKSNVEQIIISGPRIEEIDKVGKSIFGIETKDHTTNISPVLNLTYSIKKIDNKYYFKQYCGLTKQPIIREIDNTDSIEGYGQKQYSDRYLTYLSSLVNSVGYKSQNIIFAPTSSTARKIAIALEVKKEGELENELIEYYRSTIRDNYSLCVTLSKGVAYHHGKIPMHVRRTLERAISDKKITNVVCTTTLLQGVNLPAQNVFIRNPHLYINKKVDSSELTNYEMANLRGRAGRLLKDYVGRTFVMDEDEFSDTDGYEQMDLFEDVTKELPSGYEQRFEEYRYEIEDALEKNKTVDSTMKKYGYIISYIRHSVLKYGKESQARMRDVGINLTQKQVAAIIMKLQHISVPREVCYKNRYWDPFVLDKIYTDFDGNVPSTPMEKGARGKIDKLMKFLRDTDETADMYDKYVPRKYQNGKFRSIMVSLSIQWATGEKLRDILKGERYDGEEGMDNIDDTIELLQNTISFSIPLLLKPIYDMKNPDSCFLTCMQAGALCNTIRCMIEMGIPRETALYLFDEVFNKKDYERENKTELENEIRKKIKEKYIQLPYWIRTQLEFLV
jgi:hypothetical protein